MYIFLIFDLLLIIRCNQLLFIEEMPKSEYKLLQNCYKIAKYLHFFTFSQKQNLIK